MPLETRVHERISEAFNPKTVKIGDRVWMAEDLSVDDGKAGIVKLDGAYYYTESALKRICPDGWHIPSSREWNTAIRLCGGSLIPAYRNGYAPEESYKNIGTFISRLNLELNGICQSNNPVNAGAFNRIFGNIHHMDEQPRIYVGDKGHFGYYWASDTDDGKIYARQVSDSQISGVLQSFSNGMSVRLVKDRPEHPNCVPPCSSRVAD